MKYDIKYMEERRVESISIFFESEELQKVDCFITNCIVSFEKKTTCKYVVSSSLFLVYSLDRSEYRAKLSIGIKESRTKVRRVGVRYTNCCNRPTDSQYM